MSTENAELLIHGTRCFGDDEWYREFELNGVRFMAPLDRQDEARRILRSIAPTTPPPLAGEGGEAVLDAPARVGGVRFGKGVKWSTVIGCAQRAATQEPLDPALTAKLRDALCPPTLTPSQGTAVTEDMIERATRGWACAELPHTFKNMIRQALEAALASPAVRDEMSSDAGEEQNG